MRETFSLLLGEWKFGFSCDACLSFARTHRIASSEQSDARSARMMRVYWSSDALDKTKCRPPPAPERKKKKTV